MIDIYGKFSVQVETEKKETNKKKEKFKTGVSTGMSGREMFLFDPKMVAHEVRALGTDVCSGSKLQWGPCMDLFSLTPSGFNPCTGWGLWSGSWVGLT